MKELTAKKFAEITDLACVKADTTIEELERMVSLADKWGFIGVYALPAHNSMIREMLGSNNKTFIGGAVGFPSGGASTEMKIRETVDLLDFGCGEIDMVINITWLKARMLKEFRQDLEAVVKAAEGRVVKSIIEVHYLTDEEIRIASEIAADAGISYVKTATGWAETGATFENIDIIRKAVEGSSCKIKAAGGINNPETARKMVELGVERFGCSLDSAEKIVTALK